MPIALTRRKGCHYMFYKRCFLFVLLTLNLSPAAALADTYCSDEESWLVVQSQIFQNDWSGGTFHTDGLIAEKGKHSVSIPSSPCVLLLNSGYPEKTSLSERSLSINRVSATRGWWNTESGGDVRFNVT